MLPEYLDLIIIPAHAAYLIGDKQPRSQAMVRLCAIPYKKTVVTLSPSKTNSEILPPYTLLTILAIEKYRRPTPPAPPQSGMRLKYEICVLPRLDPPRRPMSGTGARLAYILRTIPCFLLLVAVPRIIVSPPTKHILVLRTEYIIFLLRITKT